MKGGLLALMLALACSHSASQVELCDYNEILKPLIAKRWNESRTELVEVPIRPLLMPCMCEIHPFLLTIAERDPIEDAKASLASGNPHFFRTPDLGGMVSIKDFDPDNSRPLPSRMIPGLDEHPVCYERERLGQIAKSFSTAYNTYLYKQLNSQ
jgi:hypothetical protein